MGKKIEITLIVLILICLLYPAYIIFEVMLGLGIFLPNPPKPKIKSAEFSIEVTCRISGEEYTIKDTMICEYKGVENRGIASKQRVWNNYLKSGNGIIIELLNGKTSEGTFKIYKWAGRAEYYMGDQHSDWIKEEIESPDGFYINYYDKNGNCVEEGWITREEAFEKYGFELVSVEHTPPLVGNCD